MITKVNAENATAYEKLFKKANPVIGLNDENGLASLDEYFQWIKDLATAPREEGGGLEFTVLPLDEPAFEINANTRTINVPNEFKANGISVQGDEGAEIVYFKIDRYFDATDLGADDTKIIIQWQNAEPTPVAGTSWAAIRDIESEPGKLIFGWYLDEAITRAPGSIKFAVRIYKEDAEGTQVYNFSTLIASAIIQPSLNLDLSDGNYYMDDNPEQWIKDRLINSPETQTTTPANKPVYVINLLPYEGEGAGLVELDPATNKKVLRVETKTNDAGVVAYEWHKWNVTDSNQAGTPNILDGEKRYESIDGETVFNEGSIYYRPVEVVGRNGEVTIKYVPLTDIVAGEDIQEYCDNKNLAGDNLQKTQIKRCFGVCEISSTGYYQVVAQNRVGKSKNFESSFVALVPGPTTNHVFEIAPGSEGEYDKNVINGGVAHVFLDEVGLASPKVAVDDDPLNTTTYAWEKDDVDLEVNAPSIDVEVEDADRKNYDEVYKVSVYDSRNGDDTEIKEVSFRVTDRAQELTVQNPYDGVLVKRIKKEYVQGNELVVELDLSEALHDEIQYQWREHKADIDGEGQVLEFDPSNDVDVANASGVITDFENDKISFVPSFERGEYGDYYCAITNCIKDGDVIVDSKTFYSPVFTVTRLA